MPIINTALKQRLIAHRGDSDHYPENSLQGFRSALDAGACFVETDIQITKDNVAILSHDSSLKKITGDNILVSECYFNAIKNLAAPYRSKFGDCYADYRLATLTQLCGLISAYPKVKIFVEIKHECVVSHANKALDIVLDAISSIKNQVVLISFNHQILMYAKKVCPIPLAWVWPVDSVANIEQAEHKYAAQCRALNPQYVFCDKDVIPPNNSYFWRGSCLKVIYTIAAIKDYKTYAAMGFNLFETNNITGHYDAL